jgi:ribose 5-phosphate isomerase B
MEQQTIAIGSDHAGFEQKQALIQHLQEAGYTIMDFGTNSLDSVDYPDYAHTLAQWVSAENGRIGILLCGSGNGVCMTANKHQGIRAGLAWQKEVASLLRQHNNANVLCLPARFLSADEIWDCTQAYLNATFEGGRHQNRVEKIEIS